MTGEQNAESIAALRADSPARAVPGLGDRYLTADIPPVGGVLKQRPEDFLVEEQPLYEPCGEGEHLYLLVQKRGLATSQVVQLLARHFRVRPSDIGYAGLKDKHALTRQVLSVHAPGKRPEDFPSFEHDRVAILWADLHTNKLRPGHLRGNRFSIRIRAVDMTRAVAAQKVLSRLEAIGVPNLAGEQRFGSRLNNHILGALDLLGDARAMIDELLLPDPAFPNLNAEARQAAARAEWAAAASLFPRTARTELTVLHALARGATPEKAVAAIDHTQRRFWISSFQSSIFNRVLERRIAEGRLGALVEGDLAQKEVNDAVFAVTPQIAADPDTAARLARLEIGPSGPLWGPKMLRAAGRTDEVEREALAETRVSLDDMAAFSDRTRQTITGARRPMRVRLIDPEVEGGVDEHGPYVRCAFELPAGAFATMVMREVMKANPAPTADDPD